MGPAVKHNTTIRTTRILTLGSALGSTLLGLAWGNSALAQSIPWQWLLEQQDQALDQRCALISMVRSQPLISPDQTWQVYSRLDLRVDPSGELLLTSHLFARDQISGSLHQIYSSTPLDPEFDLAVLVPYGWQQQRLLVQERQGIWQSDILADRAVIWQSGPPSGGIRPGSPMMLAALAPVGLRTSSSQIQVRQPPQAQAITELLGWDPEIPDQVLFGIGEMGEIPQVISLGSSGFVPKDDLDMGSLSSSFNPDPEFVPPGLAQAPDWQLALPLGSSCRQAEL
jgi:hypothetical protein